MVLNSYNYNYHCPVDGGYGKKIMVFTTTTEEASQVKKSDAASSSVASASIETIRKHLEESARQLLDDGPTEKKNQQSSPERHSSQEESRRRLQVQQLERVHKESLRDKEDTIANLRDVIQEHERRMVEMENKTDENINAQQGRPSARAHSIPTQKLLDQIEKLQSEKEALLRKVADLESRDSSLGAGKYELDGKMQGHHEHSYQMSSCTTDTEKELEKMKRYKYFLDKEIMRLRDENVQLREKLTSMGVDLSDIQASSSPIPKFDDTACASACADFGYSSLSGSSRRTSAGEISHDKLGDSGFMDNISLSSLDGQIQFLQQELDHKTEELRLAESRRDDQEVERLKGVINTLSCVTQAVYREFMEVKRSYLALKEEMKSVPASFGVFMEQMQKQVQRSLADINGRHNELIGKYLREMKLRKKYHNELVELRGNIRVFCRVRPSIKEDGMDENDIVVTLDNNDDSLLRVNNKGRMQFFDLDKVFGMDSTQNQIFDEVSALVRSVIDGYNVCIFAYGQTGSGKTYTMEGPRSDPGINQRALELLFEETSEGNWQYEISASVMEIYNEVIRDLLNPDPTNKLEVRMKQEGGLHVPGLVLVPVTSLDEINEVFETGRKNRATACTNMNEHSSRSHCLLCITVTGYNPDTGSKSFGRLNLVDLAGSERVSKSMADGVQLKEAQSINKSLSCLGDVIHALRSKQGHVPYRNSKLTYLLQDSLGGDSKTLMIVQVAPVEKNVSETVCTLAFGQRVRAVELGTATKNVEANRGTPTTSKRPANLFLYPSSASTPTSPAPSPSPSSASSSPSTSRRSPFTTSMSTPSFNGRKKTLSTSSSTSSTSSSPVSSSPSTPTPSRKSSPTTPPAGRRLPQTPKAPTSPLTSSGSRKVKSIKKSATMPFLTGKVK